MAKKNNKLPRVSVAVICENVLHDANNVSSLIRIVDTFTVNGTTPRLPPGAIAFYVYLMFKSDEAVGDRQLRLIGHDPSGGEFANERQTMKFKGGIEGAAIEYRLTVPIKEAGTHWIDVFINRELMTRIPFRVKYQRLDIENQAEVRR